MAIRLPAMHAETLKLQILDPLKLGYTSRLRADDPFPSPHTQGFTLQGTADGDLSQSTPITGSHLEDEQRSR